MKKSPIFLLLYFLLLSCYHNPVYMIFDNNLPDFTPKVFAEDLLSQDSSYVGYCSFNNKDKEFYYAITNQQWNASQILRLNSKGQIDTLYYKINKNWEGEPMFTPDAKRMYFTAIIPPQNNIDWYANLYYIERIDKGWNKPKEFELNTQTSEWHISFTEYNTAYFASEREGSRLKADIFYSKLEKGKYLEAFKLPSIINTEYNDCDPLIAPDESYLIFHSDRPGGYGEHDLYIAFRKGENNWTIPVNMGEKINTSGWEMGPSFSPDGKYLFFTRRKSWDTKIPSKIFWVDIGIIENYK